ncbi:hypothetical protein DFH09DRAFT_1106475 [Mycena vulgaris]|nr:hypothetical protein DFH09DRAFT_1106475 [Mycena vulgaris]
MNYFLCPCSSLQTEWRAQAILSDAIKRAGGVDECTRFCLVIDLKPTVPIPVELNGALKRKGDDQVNDEKPAKRTKPGPKKERKSGGNDASKRKRDDEIEQGKPPKRAKISRKKEGKNGGKNSTHKPAYSSRQTAVGTVAGKIKVCVSRVACVFWVCKGGHAEERGDAEMLVAVGINVEAVGTKYQRLTYSGKAWSGKVCGLGDSNGRRMMPMKEKGIEACRRRYFVASLQWNGWVLSEHKSRHAASHARHARPAKFKLR